jgi:ubiquinol-cytochrome c reductase iron-sulfur subunit
MRRLGRWLLVLLPMLGARHRPPPPGEDDGERERIVAPGEPSPRAELAVLVLLGLATLLSVGFIVVYATDSLGNRTQLLCITLGGALAMLAIALIVVAKRLVVSEELEGEYHEGEPSEQEAVARIIDESGSRFTRKRLLTAAGAGAGTTLGLALLTPALSLGPLLDTSAFSETPWRRGRRLVDSENRPLLADDIEQETFYTAYAEGVDKDDIGSPVVVVRLDESALRLPAERAQWAPGGILAFSKVCTHAGCAIALYRKPTFAPTQPRPALVCPCHYSTFDPATGGEVIFGPAGRPLPQLPLIVDSAGHLRAGGNYSGKVGPSWSGVRSGRPT